jgi:branched-chain amino acid transport system substrate-binding protein
VVDAFKAKYNDDYYAAQTHSIITMLSQAVKTARTTDPVKVAFALEGMQAQSLNGGVTMQKADHQLQQPLYIGTWTKVNGKDVKYDQENTGYGWKMNKKIDAYVAGQPTSCQMKRPG